MTPDEANGLGVLLAKFAHQRALQDGRNVQPHDPQGYAITVLSMALGLAMGERIKSVGDPYDCDRSAKLWDLITGAIEETAKLYLEKGPPA